MAQEEVNQLYICGRVVMSSDSIQYIYMKKQDYLLIYAGIKQYSSFPDLRHNIS